MKDELLFFIMDTPQQRAEARADLVDRYVELVGKGGKLPPVRISREGAVDYYVLSGEESILAAERLGYEALPVIVEPRTSEQKREDVLAFLSDSYWRTEPTRNIARYCGVRPELVVKLRAEYGDPAGRRQVYAGGKTYSIKPGVGRARKSAVPVFLYDERFASPQTLLDLADVILSAPPCVNELPISYCARRMKDYLSEDGALYLLFTPDEMAYLVVWREELEKVGLPFAALLCWQVTKCAPGLPILELILAMGKVPLLLKDTPVISGPRAPGAQDSTTLYRKPAWLAARLLKAHQGAAMLDPFVRTSFALQGAQRSGAHNASGYLLTSQYSDEAIPFVAQP